jgi:MoxR-like ATPase
MRASTKDLLSITEGILAATLPVKKVPVVTESKVDEDIKDVVVPDSFVNSILSFSTALNEAKATEEPQAVKPLKKVDETEVLQKKVNSIVERLKSILAEAREVLTELTSTGMIGCGTQKKLMMRKDQEYPPKPKKKK